MYAIRSYYVWGNKTRLKSSYDAVIIGGGLHGLATAYYLAKEHGITDVAIIEKRFRITSYNVCYTKLLRGISSSSPNRILPKREKATARQKTTKPATQVM